MGDQPYGLSHEACLEWAQGIKELVDSGVQTAVVIGAGNIFRGIQGEKLGLARTPADHMGMLATVMNGIALEQAILKVGGHAMLMSAIDCHPIAAPYHWQTALHHLEKKCALIFVGGTGSPYFTTDTAAALRASEIGADVLLKATKVDGVYSKDPILYPDAVRYETLTYSEALSQKLNVMDATAFALCMANNIPIRVFNMKTKKLKDVLQNKNLGTLVH